MSETGLFSGLYQNLHDYADLVDRVLVSIKTGRSNPIDPSRKELGNILIQLSQDQTDDLPARLVQLTLHSRSDVNAADLARVGNALLSEEIREDTIARLEVIAQALEEEQTRAISRIQRWTS